MESREHQAGRRDLPVAMPSKTESEVQVPPVWARLVVGTTDRTLYSAADEGPGFKLAFGAGKAVDNMSVVADTPHGREVLWQGKPEQATTVMLTRRHFGAGPAVIPIAIEFDSTQRRYVLFVPMLKRLGETAGGPPTGVYTGQSLRQVLADFSALTGLVLLAEEPLDKSVKGRLPQGETDAVLAEVAEQVGLQVQREDGLLRNLTQKPAE
jgi:hypothetical protein